MSKLAIMGGKPLLKKYDFKIKLTKEEICHVTKTLQQGNLTTFEGKNKVEQFEKEYAKYHAVKYAVACNSGTSSIHSAIAAMMPRENGEVIVPTYTFITGVTPMLLEGLQPVFVDITKKNLGMDAKLVRTSVTDNTIGVIPAHLYGFPCEIKSIQKTSKKNNLFLIEDCAQAHGAKVGNKVVGSFGDAGCFSFYLYKNITTGEGGMTTTNNEEIFKELKTMRQCGKRNADSKEYDRLAFNYRMTDFTAAIGISQLKKLDSNNKKRKINAKIYTKCFKKLGFELIPEQEGTDPVYFKFPVLLPEEIAKKKDFFVNALKEENATLPLFNTIPLNKVNFLKELSIKNNFSQKFFEENFPVTDEVNRRIMAFFCHSQFPTDKVRGVCEAVEKVVKNANW